MACARRQQQNLPDGEGDDAGAVPRLRHGDRSYKRPAPSAGIGWRRQAVGTTAAR
jgi:hypothetical protein